MKEVGARQTDKKAAKIIRQGEAFRAQREREKKIKSIPNGHHRKISSRIKRKVILR